MPESPRYLISHDRHEEALAILIKYHGEDDASSPLVHAEMVQIRETIKTESEVSKQSWLAVLATSGMRRRFLITIFIGLFTQLSGNTLLSYYSGVLFGMMGYTDTWTTTRINLANACWGLLNGTIIALVVTRFKRRHMYMLSAILMMCSFIAMTVSLQRIQLAESNGVRNVSAGISALFWYFAFNPCYNIGNNALTYSKLAITSRSVLVRSLSNIMQRIWSSSGRTPIAAVASAFSRSLASLLVSSRPMSTRLPSMPSSGSTLPSTAVGSFSSSALSSSYTPRRAVVPWKNWHSVRLIPSPFFMNSALTGPSLPYSVRR